MRHVTYLCASLSLEHSEHQYLLFSLRVSEAMICLRNMACPADSSLPPPPPPVSPPFPLSSSPDDLLSPPHEEPSSKVRGMSMLVNVSER